MVLFEVEGLTLKEISEVLKVPLQTVWSRIYNGRKELFAKLSDSLNS
ncbi:MAG TPA: sigma factor-like helix-turn-helix DNA-binding protein [bacterium]|nr:sigma factor-like helix-turn-helix DNA-binding protein [bacterium]